MYEEDRSEEEQMLWRGTTGWCEEELAYEDSVWLP